MEQQQGEKYRQLRGQRDSLRQQIDNQARKKISIENTTMTQGQAAEKFEYLNTIQDANKKFQKQYMPKEVDKRKARFEQPSAFQRIDLGDALQDLRDKRANQLKQRKNASPKSTPEAEYPKRPAPSDQLRSEVRQQIRIRFDQPIIDNTWRALRQYVNIGNPTADDVLRVLKIRKTLRNTFTLIKPITDFLRENTMDVKLDNVARILEA